MVHRWGSDGSLDFSSYLEKCLEYDSQILEAWFRNIIPPTNYISAENLGWPWPRLVDTVSLYHIV